MVGGDPARGAGLSVKGEGMTPLERLADRADGIGTLFDRIGPVGAIQRSVLVRPMPKLD